MSWALVQDSQNMLRNGRGEVASAPMAEAGTSVRALHDGAVSVPYTASGEGWIELEYEASPVDEGLLMIVLDFRYIGSALVSLGEGLAGQAISQEEIERGSFARFLGWTAAAEMHVDCPSRWSVGEILLVPRGGIVDPVISREYSDPPHPEMYRVLEVAQEWNTITNGPWRSKLSEPRRQYDLAFAAGREEWLDKIYRESEGGLRPVVLFPRLMDGLDPGEPLHGHLSDEYQRRLELGGVWGEGRLLSFTESDRRLR